MNSARPSGPRFLQVVSVAASLATGQGFAQGEKPTVILETGSKGWSHLHPVDETQAGFDPAETDLDFNATWFDPHGKFLGGAPYDGPEFTTGGEAPFFYGIPPGFHAGGTEFVTPLGGTRGSFYLLKEIDGGAEGYRDLTFNIWARDGCYIYLNGELAATTNMDASAPDTWAATAPSLIVNSYRPAVPARQAWLKPGPNLLAISVHNEDLKDPNLGISLQIVGTPGPPLPVKLKRKPYLQMATPDSMTICWQTDHHADSSVWIWSGPGEKPVTLNNETLTMDHKFELTNLRPDTLYYYSIKSRDILDTEVVWGGEERDWFRTAPLAGVAKPTRIWVIGDSGSAAFLAPGDDRARSVFDGFLNFADDKPPDVWLMLGDNAYSSGTDVQYQKAVFDLYTEILSNTPLWPALGNHDRINSPVFQDIFELPSAGEAGGMPSGTELYYSFDHGDIHFICLDSSTFETVDPSRSTTMYDWLEADLASTDQEWIIAYFHHGPYTKGSHNSDAEIQHIFLRENAIPVLEAYGVDLVLSGHSHTYERSMLIDGHYGLSNTFDPATMVVDGGNGSDLGSVSEEGEFLEGLGMGGAYEKPAGTGNAGAVYSTVGCSGLVSRWTNGSTDLVNPEPHAVMLVNLLQLGSMVIDIEPHRLNARFLDDRGIVRDDFTILKGSTVTVEAIDPVFVEKGDDVTATIRFSRTGATGIPLEADFSLTGTAELTIDYASGDPVGGIIPFSSGQGERDVVLRRINDEESEGWETVNFALKESPFFRIGVGKESATAFLLENAFEGWVLARLGFENFALGSGPDDDPDHDGWSNLLEYALGGEPLVPDSDLGLVLAAEGPFLALNYHRDASKADLAYLVEASTDLEEWSDAPIIHTLMKEADAEGIEQWQALVVDVGLPNPYRFLRLRVNLLP